MTPVCSSRRRGGRPCPRPRRGAGRWPVPTGARPRGTGRGCCGRAGRACPSCRAPPSQLLSCNLADCAGKHIRRHICVGRSQGHRSFVQMSCCLLTLPPRWADSGHGDRRVRARACVCASPSPRGAPTRPSGCAATSARRARCASPTLDEKVERLALMRKQLVRVLDDDGKAVGPVGARPRRRRSCVAGPARHDARAQLRRPHAARPPPGQDLVLHAVPRRGGHRLRPAAGAAPGRHALPHLPPAGPADRRRLPARRHDEPGALERATTR